MPKFEYLIIEAKRLIDMGIYDPEELYGLIQKNNQFTHYSTIRKAIHVAKTGIYK